jgi:glycosyltransferase involved in cell wall biosynthesis
MRILYISDSSIPSFSANSIHVMKMCQAWAELGHDITLVGKLTNASLPNVQDVFSFYGIGTPFKLEVFPFIAFPGSGRVYNLMLPLKLLRKYDLLYTRSIYAAFWCTIVGKKFVFEVHEPYDTKNRWLKFMFNRISKSGCLIKFVTISDALKQYLTGTLRIGSQRISVAHDGADPLDPSSARPPLAGSGGIRVGYTGSLLKGKGMEIIIPLSSACTGFEFHIVGGKSADVEAMKAQLPPGQGNVIFYGNVPHRDIPGYLLQFDILIAPYLRGVFVKSATDSNNIAMWMSPLKIFEYMSSGKPILTSDLPVLKEILRHRENAYLCDPGDVASWKEGLSALSGDPALARTLGENAKRDFTNLYTWKSRAANILNSITRP